MAFVAAVSAALVGVPWLAWRSMNLGTFVCFGLVVAWIVNTERQQIGVSRALKIAEMRVRALEEYAGIRRAYCDEVESAMEQHEMFKGALCDYIQWPHADDMVRWRRRHWAAWSARQHALESQPLDAHVLGDLDDHQERQPYIPPPDGSKHDELLAYWSDPKRWQ